MRKSNENWNRVGRWFIGMTFVAAFAASVFLLSGCGETPMSQVVPDAGLEALEHVDHTYGDVFAEDPGASAKLLSNLLRDVDLLLTGEDGGLLSVDLGSKKATLDIPAGAVNEPVLIVMDAVQVPGLFGETTLFDFGPDGLVFSSPATLTLETNKSNGSALRLYWWNPDGLRWELQESATVGDGKVSFTIHHFSKYGIS